MIGAVPAPARHNADLSLDAPVGDIKQQVALKIWHANVYY
jgi:hypothetical protein